jgi:hypothetical protein
MPNFTQGYDIAIEKEKSNVGFESPCEYCKRRKKIQHVF